MNIERERAEFEAWYAAPNNNGTAWEAWQAALASQQVQALRRDAERYRWLRGQHEKPVGGLTICEVGTWDLKPWSGDDPDAAIDAAMEKQK